MSAREKVPKRKAKRLLNLLLSLSGVTRYLCPEEKLAMYLGEPVSFEKHLRPLMEEGTLYFAGVPDPGGYFDSLSYREAFDHSTGRIADYSGGKEPWPTWIAFWYRENDFLKDVRNIEEDAVKLGLLPKGGK